MGIDQMRNEIEKVYPYDSWKRKVAFMGENQVVAVYYKFLGEGRFDAKPLPKKPKVHQMSLEEYILEVAE